MKTFLKTNLLRFSKRANKSNLDGLNSSVSELKLDSFNIDLDTNLLNTHIFRSIRLLYIEGRVNSIQSDLFENFHELRVMHIRADSFRQLMSRRHGIEWIRSINKWMNVNMSDQLEINQNWAALIVKINLHLIENSFFDRESNYFTDADFCLFSEFPFHQMIMFSISEHGNTYFFPRALPLGCFNTFGAISTQIT